MYPVMYIYEKIDSYPQYGTGLFLLLIQNQAMAVTTIIHNYTECQEVSQTIQCIIVADFFVLN